MTKHEKAIIDYSVDLQVFACYCDGENYGRIARLCLDLGIRFCNYDDEYLIFSEDVTEALRRKDPSLEFRIDRENWGCLSGEILGHRATCNYVSVRTWNRGTQEYDRTIYHKE